MSQPVESTEDGEEATASKRSARVAAVLRRVDGQPRLVTAARALRARLPGDRRYGDPLSLAGSEPPQLIGQRVAALTARRPSALREAGLGALQVWQSLSEAQGRGRGDEPVAILFTDLVGFSTWALEAGDTMAIELLRGVGEVAEPPIESCGGRIVKRLGDGLMATFDQPQQALEAALAIREGLDRLEVGGHRPRLRAGVHVGRPRRLGGDYFGIDVNIAARVAAAADGDEVLVSGPARDLLDPGGLELERRSRLKAKGAPKGLDVYAVRLAH